MKYFKLLSCFLFVVIILSCEKPPKQEQTSHVEVPEIAPLPEDVSTIDGMINAYYDVISGPAGQKRQWARDRTLYMKDMRFVVMSQLDGKPTATIMDHQAYVDDSDEALEKEGFFEVEINRITNRFGNIAQVFSTYESRKTEDGPVIARGVNSIQLFYDGNRWWISSAMWDEERPDNLLTNELLGK